VRKWLAEFALTWGLDVEFTDTTDLDAVAAAIRPGRTRLLWVETPANPMWEITDLAAVCELAHAAGARVAVDNTVATPVLTRPFEFGADIVVHSASKYLNGHSDVLAGAVLSARRDPFWERIRSWRRHLERNLPAGQRPLGPHDPPGDRRLRREEPARDLPGGQAAEQAEGERDPRLDRQHGMAEDEHQPQQVVVYLFLAENGIELRWGTVPAGFQLTAKQAQLAGEPPVPADPVDGAVPGGEHEPRTRVGRDALGRPLFQRRDEGVLRQLPGQADVPDQPGKAGDDPGRLQPPHRLDRAMRRRGIRGH
jgi:hypothetical protein